MLMEHFKTVPSSFAQLYSIHGVKSGNIIPFVYVCTVT